MNGKTYDIDDGNRPFNERGVRAIAPNGSSKIQFTRAN